MPGAAQGFLGVEWQLEGRRLAVARVPLAIVQYDDQRTPLGHRPSRDDEGLDQRKGQVVELDAGDAHDARSRNRSSPPRRSSTPAASRSSIAATRPCWGSKSR